MWQLPDGIDPALWHEFEEHRRDIKRKLTDRARAIAAKKLLGLTPEQQRDTVERTIESGWTGLFPQKDETAKTIRQFSESASAKASRIWRERNGDSKNAVSVDGGELRGAVSRESGRRDNADVLGTVLAGEYKREES